MTTAVPPRAPYLILPSRRLTPNTPLVETRAVVLKTLKLKSFLATADQALAEADAEAAARFSSAESKGHDVRAAWWTADRGSLALFRLGVPDDGDALTEFHAALFDPSLPTEVLRGAVLYARLLRDAFDAQDEAFRDQARTLVQPTLIAWADAEFDRLGQASELWRTFVERFSSYGVSSGWAAPAEFSSTHDAAVFDDDEAVRAAIATPPLMEPTAEPPAKVTESVTRPAKRKKVPKARKPL
jgi:hypothetical protein